MGGTRCVFERRINLRMALPVVLARDSDGRAALWSVVEHRHKDGMLDQPIVPARVPGTLAAQAKKAARIIADALAYPGVRWVAFFVDEDGARLVNDFASRPHNSGHGTLDASRTAEFEQQVRMLAGRPLGNTTLRSPVVMQNLLGD